MDKNEHWIRLQVTGGAGFNFVLPANPNWKVSQLQQHMIQIYNEIASNESNSYKAIKVRSIKRNGFYIASSLKVGNAFADWDQVTCNIVTSNQSKDNDQGIKQVEIKEKEKKKKSHNKQQKEKKSETILDNKPNNDQVKKNQSDSKKQVKPQIIPEKRLTTQEIKDMIIKKIQDTKRETEEKEKKEQPKKEKSKSDKKNDKNNKQKEPKEPKEVNKEKKNEVEEKKSKYKQIRVIDEESDVSK